MASGLEVKNCDNYGFRPNDVTVNTSSGADIRSNKPINHIEFTSSIDSKIVMYLLSTLLN